TLCSTCNHWYCSKCGHKTCGGLHIKRTKQSTQITLQKFTHPKNMEKKIENCQDCPDNDEDCIILESPPENVNFFKIKSETIENIEPRISGSRSVVSIGEDQQHTSSQSFQLGEQITASTSSNPLSRINKSQPIMVRPQFNTAEESSEQSSEESSEESSESSDDTYEEE
ncbi:43536_t:CDS:1, partial [Gigaspora margarita]